MADRLSPHMRQELDNYITGHYGEDQYPSPGPNWRKKMGRKWRVAGSFHRIGEVAVSVTSPNWQGALRKGALALKAAPELKGRKIKAAVITLQEVEVPTFTSIDGTQLSLPSLEGEDAGIEDQTPPSKASSS